MPRHTDNTWLERISGYLSGNATNSQGLKVKIADPLDSSGNLPVNQVTLIAGEDLTNNRMLTRKPANYTNIAASTLIKTGAGIVSGFIVNSHTGGTLKLWDNTSAATTVLLNTITFAAGPNFVDFGSDVIFSTGLYATIGGTADITIFWA